MTPTTCKQPVALSWSGGKDSALALHALQQGSRYQVVSLLTTLSAEFGRISHHGVRETLLDAQAESIGLPLKKIMLPTGGSDRCINAVYENLMRDAMQGYHRQGVRTIVFGDIFLQDLRDYREGKLREVGMNAIFPIWGIDTTVLVRRFIELGFKAYLCCVCENKLGADFVGRPIDDSLLTDLPAGVDPCGENGEYHSFVHDGPIFKYPVRVAVGEKAHRDVRWFAELLPADIAPAAR